MAITCERTITLAFTGGFTSNIPIIAVKNTNSPGVIEMKTLAVGNTTITPPSGGTVPKSVTIVPPSGNTIDITLKGVAGDTGIVIHNTEPTSIALDNPAGTFVLSVGTQVDGVRLYWA